MFFLTKRRLSINSMARKVFSDLPSFHQARMFKWAKNEYKRSKNTLQVQHSKLCAEPRLMIQRENLTN